MPSVPVLMSHGFAHLFQMLHNHVYRLFTNITRCGLGFKNQFAFPLVRDPPTSVCISAFLATLAPSTKTTMMNFIVSFRVLLLLALRACILQSWLVQYICAACFGCNEAQLRLHCFSWSTGLRLCVGSEPALELLWWKGVMPLSAGIGSHFPEV